MENQLVGADCLCFYESSRTKEDRAVRGRCLQRDLEEPTHIHIRVQRPSISAAVANSQHSSHRIRMTHQLESSTRSVRV